MFSDSIDLGGKFTCELHQRKLGFGVKKEMSLQPKGFKQNNSKLLSALQFWVLAGDNRGKTTLTLEPILKIIRPWIDVGTGSLNSSPFSVVIF